RVHCTRCGRPICPDCMEPAPVGHHCPTCDAEGRRSIRRLRLGVRSGLSAAMVLLGINVAVFLVEVALGGATDLGVLVRMGALVPALIVEGEYWRLFASMFLHVGLLHLLFNSFGLYIFGNLIEGALGRVRFLAVYFLSGITAGSASFAFGSPGRVAAGASGAIFGLLGAWLAFNWRRRETGLAQANIQGALVLVGLNLFLGFSVPGIDNIAHMGGLIAGAIAGLAAEGVGSRPLRIFSQIAGFAFLIGAAVSLVAWRVEALGA
ncbi:MAG: rhomboid family intramembrane serine protease, partial [bacterium]